MQPIVSVDGRPPDVSDLLPFALINDGHFTAMQVRDRRTRGVELHLRRLVDAHRELYGTDLDPGLVRSLMRRAVTDHPDAYLRTTVLETSPGQPSVLTVVRPPVDPDPRPQRLVPVTWTRPSAGLKHVGTFPQIQLGRTAEADGYDDALLVDTDGFVAETTIANIAFVRGREVVWPEGPVLPGITWQLLDEQLPDHGYTARRQRVRLADVGSFDAAVLANSIGVVPVGRIGDHRLESAGAAAELAGIYDAVPQQAL